MKRLRTASTRTLLALAAAVAV
ncbi:MAG: hypothetical protein QOE29_779, partial [Gaiellaceae bacterium]|nr:hypothetical protein [Gaiellaceae bacterium]